MMSEQDKEKQGKSPEHAKEPGRPEHAGERGAPEHSQQGGRPRPNQGLPDPENPDEIEGETPDEGETPEVDGDDERPTQLPA
jgi:hypothetical protein